MVFALHRACATDSWRSQIPDDWPFALDLYPGEKLEQAFHLEAVRLNLRIVDHERVPVVRRTFTLRNAQTGYVGFQVTDENGWIVVEPLAPGTYVVGKYRSVGDPAPGAERTGEQAASLQASRLIVLGQTTWSASSRTGASCATGERSWQRWRTPGPRLNWSNSTGRSTPT